MSMNLFTPPIVNSGRKNQSDGTGQSLKRIFLVNSCFLLLPSYVLHHYLDLHINSLFAIICIASVIVCFHETRWRIHQGVLKLALLLISFGSVGSVLAGAYSQFLMSASLALNLIIAFNGSKLFTHRTSLNYLTFIASVLVSGAVFALLYAFSGGAPLDRIDLYGRDSYFYLTTFTNAVTGNLIRPAGIFDEPGALAMFVTLVVALNEVFRVNTKWSAAILCAGLASGSLALFIVAIVYLLFKLQRKSLLLVATVVVVMLTLVAFNDKAATIADNFFLDRLEVVDGRLVGDSRTHQMQFFFDTVDWEMTIRGQKASSKAYGDHDVSSNPFSIFFEYGLVIWIPYGALEVWLLYCSFFFRPHLRFPSFALFFTLLQRPYLYSMHWGTMIAVLVIVIYRAQREMRSERMKKLFCPRNRSYCIR
jgi:hypothetical protein